MLIIKHPNKSLKLFSFLLVLLVTIASLTISERNKTELIAGMKLKLVSFDSGYASPPTFLNFLRNLPRFVGYQLRSAVAEDKIQSLHIDIKLDDLQTILDDRAQALENTILSQPTTVPATIRSNGKSFKADVRLKGDLEGHWYADKRFSLRVKLKGSKTINKYRTFSLHQPAQRQHPYDQIFHDLHRKAGGLGAFHDYVHVYVNGENWGIMNIEEHVTKELIEKQSRKSTIAFRFGNEEINSYERTAQPPIPEGSFLFSDPILHLNLYQSKKTLKSEQARSYLSYVVQHRLKDNNAYLYDTDSFSKLLILSEIWNNRHVLHFMNSRFYFNPYTLKIEPISSDQGGFRNWRAGRGGSTFSAFDYKLYRELAKTEGFSDNFVSNFNKVNSTFNNLDEISNHYESYFPLEKKVKIKTLRTNKNTLKKQKSKIKARFLNLANKSQATISAVDITKRQSRDIKRHIMAIHETDGTIKIFKLFDYPVTISDISRKKRTIKGFNPTTLNASNFEPYQPDLVLKSEEIGVLDGQIKIQTIVEGIKREYTIAHSLVPEDKLLNPFISIPNADHEMLQKTDENEWTINDGKWVIEEPIRVKGNVTIKAGADLMFNKDALFLIEGGLSILGTEDNKVTMRPTEDSWRGLFVKGANDEAKVTIQNAEILNTNFFKYGVMSLTGGVNIYKADTVISNSSFINTDAEDALNIIRSRYIMDNTTIIGSRSDGFDSDFSNGEIINFKGSNIGGDALDFSGGYTVINGANIDKVVDKAISAGEASKLSVSNAIIKDAGVGIASKDGSAVTAKNINLQQIKLSPGMVYQKKSFYDSSSMLIEEVKGYGLNDFIVQDGGYLEIDGRKVATTSVDTDYLYNNTIMKK